MCKFFKLVFLFSIAFSTNAEPLPTLAIHYPPYTSADKNSPNIITNHIRSKLLEYDIELDLHILPLSRLEHTLNGLSWCASLIKPSQLNQKIIKVKFDQVNIKHRLYRLSRNTVFAWNSMTELAGLTLAIPRSINKNQVSETLMASGIKMIPINSSEQGIKLLLRNRVDLFFSDNIAIAHLLRKSPREALSLQASDNILFTTPVELWLNLECPSALKAALLMHQSKQQPSVRR